MWKALEEECSGQREEQVQRPGSWRRLKNREEARQLEENGRESGQVVEGLGAVEG